MKRPSRLAPWLLLLVAAALVIVALLRRPSTKQEDTAIETEARHADRSPHRRLTSTDDEPRVAERPTPIDEEVRRAFAAEMPPRVAALLGDDSEWNSRQRVEWLREHSGNLSPADLQAILAFIESGRVPAGLSATEWHWLGDQLFTAMRRSATDRPRLSRRLEGIFSNRSVDPTIRDYALQHIGHLVDDGGDAVVAWQAARAGLAETDGAIAGTALLLLDDKLSRSDNGDDVSRPPRGLDDTGELALQLLRDPQSSTATRITALTVASARDADGVEPIARGFLEGDLPAQLQLTAAAVLIGRHGVDALQDLEVSHDGKGLNPVVNHMLLRAELRAATTE